MNKEKLFTILYTLIWCPIMCVIYGLALAYDKIPTNFLFLVWSGWFFALWLPLIAKMILEI